MTDDPISTTSISILEREYRISAPRSQQDALLQSARCVDDKMREIRATGKIVGTERIAVMAALNIAHEMLQIQSQNIELNQQAHEQIEMLLDKLDKALKPSR